MTTQKDITLLGGHDASGDINFDSAKSVSNFTETNLGKEVVLKYKRGDSQNEQSVTISSDKESPLGISFIDKQVIRVAWYMAPIVALRETGEIIKITFSFLGTFVVGLFKTRHMNEGVGGPVAIYIYTGLAVKAGLMVLMQFIALLSINLALINILPFPSLDGGRILFILLEKIFNRRVVREQVENWIHTIGFAILLVLIAFITYKDILRLIKK